MRVNAGSGKAYRFKGIFFVSAYHNWVKGGNAH
jgi:hypothetical protein